MMYLLTQLFLRTPLATETEGEGGNPQSTTRYTNSQQFVLQLTASQTSLRKWLWLLSYPLAILVVDIKRLEVLACAECFTVALQDGSEARKPLGST